MKLLSRLEINNLKGGERKKEIDEGVKLAKKIDLLRETAAKEEANLAKFRTESLKIIREEIFDLTNFKQKIMEEIMALKNARADLQLKFNRERDEIINRNN